MFGAEAVPALMPAPVASSDTLLIELGRASTAMAQRCADLDASAEGTAAERTAACLMSNVLRKRIMATPARTMDGLDVKISASGMRFDA